MIKKLQKQFVIIMMTVVMTVILAVLVIMCWNNYQRYKSDSEKALEMALNREDGSLKMAIGKPDSSSGTQNNQGQPGSGGPNKKNGQFRTAVFTVTVNDSNVVTDINDTGVEISDDVVVDVVEEVLNSGKSSGTVNDPNLRYDMKETDSGRRIAFADIGDEVANMKNLYLESLMIFFGTAVVFFLISLILSKWVVRPVSRAWDQQKQFVADASHELKTPLTVILANLGILRSHGDSTIKEQEKWMDNTEAEAVLMKGLLDDLLFLAKSDASRVPMVYSRQDFSNLLWECILPFESVAFEQQVSLEETIADGLLVQGDEKQLKQLVNILLDNACKYAKGGTVKVSLEEKQDQVRLVVTNDGERIPPEDLEHIFERFYRVDKSRVRKLGGYGLGLSIAQAIVQQHHGRIRAASSDQEGTSFTVTLPVYHE